MTTPPPLVILSPPRSFSSVVSTMIGEHPDLYGFPELHLFVGDTVQEVIDYESKKERRYTGPPGLLRALAELHDGIQTTGSVVRAAAWLSERRDWSIKKLMDHLLDAVAPTVGVEKSPVTCAHRTYLERVYALYPDAHYLHLTRHPLSSRASMAEFSSDRRARKGLEGPARVDRLIAWYHAHANILALTQQMPLGQTLRVRGEDILSEPDRYLPQISEWLGIRTDGEAIAAMKHPETSPYACIGPDPARGGNDPKFMRSPALREGKIREPNLEEGLASLEPDWFSGPFREALEQSALSCAPDAEIKSDIEALAHALGYQ